MTEALPKIDGDDAEMHDLDRFRPADAGCCSGGVGALSVALRDGLGRSLVAATETIRASQGRLIVTGMGKSGHVARKLAATFASHWHACLLRPSERGQPW